MLAAARGCAFFFSSRRRHTSSLCDWSSDVCSSDLSQCAWLSFFFAAASGLYGIGPPSTTPNPGGTAPTAPSASTAAAGTGRSEERRVGKEWVFGGGPPPHKRR